MLAPGSGRSRKPALTRGLALHDQEAASLQWGGQSPWLWSQDVQEGGREDRRELRGPRSASRSREMQSWLGVGRGVSSL